MTKLTQKQQTVLDYLHRYLGEHRRAPFLREIQEACRIASYKSVIDRLNALEHKGFIKRIPNKHRAIHIQRKAHAILQTRGAQPESTTPQRVELQPSPVSLSASASESSSPVTG